jgi:hypothetical protein
MVEENCSVPFEFRCITDKPELYPEWGVQLSRPIEWVDKRWEKDAPQLVLHRDKPQGCWAKLDAFLPTFGPGPVICLDLDIVILDDIVPLARQELHMPWQGDKFNGSVYSFTPHQIFTEALYPRNIPYREYPRGEQEFVQDSYWIGVKPLNDCYSYKIHVASRYGRNPPDGARVVYFHGYPTPATQQVYELPWVNRTWRGLERVERV